MNITYRQLNRADENDMRKLVDIVHAGLEDDQFFFKYNDQEYNDMWTKDFVIGAFDLADGLVGFNLLVIEKDYCDMDGIMILPRYRNTRIMQEMCKHLIEHAIKIGAKKIIAKIHPDNKNIINSPEKAGFVSLGTKPMPPYGALRTVFELSLETI